MSPSSYRAIWVLIYLWIRLELIHTENVETEHNTSFHQNYTTGLKCMPRPPP